MALLSAVDGPNVARRHVLMGLAGGLFLLPVFRANAMLKSDRSEGRLIRPPGAIPENQFLARCIACGQCLKACPTNALQPCTAQAGLPRLFTPRVVPRTG
ncbi:MAG: 4Fe-4S binding protein, partial [Chitinivibrionales bacterium]|nr:4Fe-4S binding protein [Chitinivibrionales bacterium]